MPGNTNVDGRYARKVVGEDAVGGRIIRMRIRAMRNLEAVECRMRRIRMCRLWWYSAGARGR
jgi:hypothetical protein